MMSEYAYPDTLVSTQWVADHIDDPRVRIVESDEDILLYDAGHIPNAVKIDWENDLQDPKIRDYIDEERFARLLSSKGIANDTQVVFYGDKNNWWACYAFWTFKLFGHEHCLIMNGGRQKWLQEERPLTREVPKFAPTQYQVRKNNTASIRAFRYDVFKHMEAGKPLIDVRSPEEFTGKLLHMPSYPQEGALRGGHIPGARNVPWAQAANEDGTFKSADDLRYIYEQEAALNPDNEVIAYCRIGERSAHTWYVLTYLLGYENVRNYDGSWTEWGNMVRAPIETENPD
jgi:thiosulfate/3-mercaptopyruvate sulfurtransferase